MATIMMRALADARACTGTVAFAGALATLVALAAPLPAHATDGDTSLEDAAVAADPLKLVVSLSEQRIDIYRGLTHIATAPVSSGQRGHATPPGVYSILQKNKWHRSNIYSRAPMPFMQRITWSGIALHAGNLPGYPASHGCIRLPKSFATELWQQTEIGVDVIVTAGVAAPRAIEHDALFQPAPPRLYTEARLQTAAIADGAMPSLALHATDLDPEDDRLRPYAERVRSPIRVLITRRTGRERMMDVQTLLVELGHDPGEADGYLGRLTGGAIQAFQESQNLPKTGMVTDELIDALYEAAGREPITGHLYVRQDYVDLFDAPIALADPDEPLGTHVYTAMNFADGATRTAWTALTMTGEETPDAEAALARFTIPDDIRARISALLTPGSSLIVTDAGYGRETGKGTDFIVQPR